MAAFAQRLKVIIVVCTPGRQRHNVVYLLCASELAILQALLTERVCRDIPLSYNPPQFSILLPVFRIALIPVVFSVGLFLMLFTILSLCQHRAAGV